MFYLLIFLCFVCLMWRVLCRKKSERQPPKLSGGLPIVGHGFLFVGDSISSYKNITWISEECLRNGGILSGHLGFRKAYCITDPEAILTISNTCLEKEYVYSFAKAFVGEGLITSTGSTWKRHRRLLSPAFSKPVLNSFIECFNSQARNLVVQLALQLGNAFDHESVLKKNNLESICLTATGVGGDEYSSLQQSYLSLVPKIQMVLYERFKQLWLHSDFIFNKSRLKKRQDVILKAYNHLSNSIIKKKKEELQTIRKNKMFSEKKSEKLKPFLELLLDISKESKCFTDEQIRNETNTIIAAGHETSATVLNLAIILLGSYQNIQEKVFNEVLQVVGDSNKDFVKDELAQLIYTEAVLKETLRLYPVVPVIARNIEKDIKLKNYTLEANSSCFLFLYGLNRHPVWGPDADQFRPERWLDTAALPDLKHFGSFAIGKRNCIGKAYAMMSMKTTLAHVIRRYKIAADVKDLVFKWHMLTYPASGHHYTLEQRDNATK